MSANSSTVNAVRPNELSSGTETQKLETTSVHQRISECLLLQA
jgi:hypothetical protein